MNSITLNIWLQHNKSKHDMFIRDILLIQLDYKGYSQTCKKRHLYANYSICSGNICILEYEATWYFSLNMIYLGIHQWPWKYNLFFFCTKTAQKIYIIFMQIISGQKSIYFGHFNLNWLFINVYQMIASSICMRWTWSMYYDRLK